MLTSGRLRELLDYDPLIGAFHWRVRRNGVLAGKPAGTIDKDGYNTIFIEGKRYRGGRLAWLFTHGEWPLEIDHINRQRSDDRIANLRSVSRSQNMKNWRTSKLAASGYRGVYFKSDRRKFFATNRENGRSVFLGHFATAAEAHQALTTRMVGRIDE